MRTSTSKQNKPTSIIMALYNKSILSAYAYVITPDGAYYVVNKKRVPAKEMESTYPTSILRRSVKGDLIGDNFC